MCFKEKLEEKHDSHLYLHYEKKPINTFLYFSSGLKKEFQTLIICLVHNLPWARGSYVNWWTEHKRTNAKATLMYNFKSECEGFIWVSKHKKTDESTRLHRPRAFIVLDCLETLMKPNAQALEIASQSCLRNKKKMEIFQFFTCCQLITCCHSN